MPSLQPLLDEVEHLLPRDPFLFDACVYLRRLEGRIGRSVGNVQRPHRVVAVVEEFDFDGQAPPSFEEDSAIYSSAQK